MTLNNIKCYLKIVLLVFWSMKMQPNYKRAGRLAGFTRNELIVVLACVAVIVGLLVPAMSKPKRGRAWLRCMRNRKQIGLAFRIFANDNDDKYPFSVEGLRLYDQDPKVRWKGGNPLVYNNMETETWHHIQVLSNELASAKVLICPEDRSRRDNEAIDFLQNEDSFAAVGRRNKALSYFVGLNANETRPNEILGGDRNIAGPSSMGPALDESKPAIPGGVHQFGPNNSAGARRRWSSHKNNRLHEQGGYIFLADGSVQRVSGEKLEDQLELSRASYGTNAWLFSFPNDPAGAR